MGTLRDTISVGNWINRPHDPMNSEEEDERHCVLMLLREFFLHAADGSAEEEGNEVLVFLDFLLEHRHKVMYYFRNGKKK